MHSDVSEIDELVAAIAVEIERSRGAIIGDIRERMMGIGLPKRIGLSPAGMQLLPFLRNLLPDRSVGEQALRACERYIPESTFNAALSELISAEVVESRDSTVTLSAGGRDIAREIHSALVAVVDERWGTGVELEDLEGLTNRAVDAARRTGGLSFSVMAPPYDPPGSSSGSRSAERVNCLRIHRGDAHADAWSSAGLSVEEVQALGPGTKRDAIERETNRRARGPYEALAPDERTLLLELLRALPG